MNDVIKNFDAVIVAAGSSVRFGENKLFAAVANETVLQRTVGVFVAHPKIDNIIIVYRKADFDLITASLKDFGLNRFRFVKGGSTRTESVENGLNEVTAANVLIHDGARPFVSEELIDRVIASVEAFGSGIPATPLSDSVRVVKDGLITGEFPRENVVSVQTPQGFSSELIKRAFSKRNGADYTDESLLFSEKIASPAVVKGDERNTKITTLGNYYGINANIGIGYDLHLLTYGRKFMLCGIELEYPLGPMAVSDGDAGIHALIDALLSAIGSRDIGSHFPENDPRCDGLDSAIMLTEVMSELRRSNFKVSNAAITLILDKPKLADYIPVMKVKLARLMDMPSEQVAISAKTTEGTNPDTVTAYAVVTVV